jgi:hypothetical protein
MSTVAKIESYHVGYYSNGSARSIGLKNAGNDFCTIFFLPDGATLPDDSVNQGNIWLYYHLEDFENVIGLLRHETTLYLLYNGSGPGYNNGITTDEAVGT